MKHIDVPQLSPAWFEARRGIATASNFSRIITAKKMEPSAQRFGLINEIIADKYRTGPADDEFISKAMQEGINREPEARCWYELHKGMSVQRVGLLVSDCGRFGCSPDSLVGDDGLLEIKCPLLKTHVEYLTAGTLPEDYKAQCHGQLIVSERSWCDFVSYAPNNDLPPLVVRVEPDAFTRALKVCLEVFLADLKEALDKIQRIIDPATRAA